MRRLIAIAVCLLLNMPVAQAEQDLLSWTLLLGSKGDTVATAIAPSNDGGVFIAGYTNTGADDFGSGYGGKDGLVLSVDAHGNVLWSGRYGGSQDDVFSQVIATADGGCLALGTTFSIDGHAHAARGGQDAFLVRLDAEGSLLWTKCLGGTLDDELLQIIETEDGNFLACGHTKSRNGDLRSNNGGWDAWITLLEGDSGKPIWFDRYGDAGDDAYTMIVPADNVGWIAFGEYGEEVSRDASSGGEYQGRPIAMLYSYEGKRQWGTDEDGYQPIRFGGTGVNRLVTLVGMDNGWMLVGETDALGSLMLTRRGGLDVWTFFLRQNGTILWQKSYGGSKADRPYTALAAAEGGYILLCTTQSTDGHVSGVHGGLDLWVVRITPDGTLAWQQAIGGSGQSEPAGLLQTPDGGFLVIGTTTSQDGDIGKHIQSQAGFLTKLSSNGNILWTRLVEETEEMQMVTVLRADGCAYLLGTAYHVENRTLIRQLWLGKLDDAAFQGN